MLHYLNFIVTSSHKRICSICKQPFCRLLSLWGKSKNWKGWEESGSSFQIAIIQFQTLPSPPPGTERARCIAHEVSCRSGVCAPSTFPGKASTSPCGNPPRLQVTSSTAEGCNNPGRSQTNSPMALDKRQNTAENFCDEGPDPPEQQKFKHTFGPTSLELLRHWTSAHTNLGKTGNGFVFGGWEGVNSSSLLTEVLLFLSMSSELSQISKRHIYMKWMDWKKNNSNAVLNKLGSTYVKISRLHQDTIQQRQGNKR